MGHSAHHWFVITPEYPPSPGGVSDYTQIVAQELARRGHVIDVWAPPSGDGAFPTAAGIRCHALPDAFGLASMRVLDAALRRAPSGTVVFVQYVPSGFGARSMNVPFTLWLGRRKERLWMMVHEAAFPYRRGARLRHQLLATVTRIMLRAALTGAERVFTSTPTWEPLIRRHGFPRGPVDWLPVPATVPRTVDAERVRRIRHELGAPPGRIVIGHFGSYGTLISEQLAATISLLSARHPEWVWLLLGRNANRFAAELERRAPRPRAVFARPDLAPAEVSNHLVAADLAVFPFPDGISARRTSAMAALAVGTPLVTTRGPSMEPFWDSSKSVTLADNRPEAIALAAAELASTPELRALLSERGRLLYDERFDVGRLADKLTRAL